MTRMPPELRPETAPKRNYDAGYERAFGKFPCCTCNRNWDTAERAIHCMRSHIWERK